MISEANNTDRACGGHISVNWLTDDLFPSSLPDLLFLLQTQNAWQQITNKQQQKAKSNDSESKDGNSGWNSLYSGLIWSRRSQLIIRKCLFSSQFDEPIVERQRSLVPHKRSQVVPNNQSRDTQQIWRRVSLIRVHLAEAKSWLASWMLRRFKTHNDDHWMRVTQTTERICMQLRSLIARQSVGIEIKAHELENETDTRSQGREIDYNDYASCFTVTWMDLLVSWCRNGTQSHDCILCSPSSSYSYFAIR